MGLESQGLEPPRSRNKVPGVRALTSGHLCQPLSVTCQGPGKHAQGGVFLSASLVVLPQKRRWGLDSVQGAMASSPSAISGTGNGTVLAKYTPPSAPLMPTLPSSRILISESLNRDLPRRPYEGSRRRIPAGGQQRSTGDPFFPTGQRTSITSLTSRAIGPFQGSKHDSITSSQYEETPRSPTR